MKHMIRSALFGVLLGCAGLYMVMHSSTCRWEQTCD